MLLRLSRLSWHVQLWAYCYLCRVLNHTTSDASRQVCNVMRCGGDMRLHTVARFTPDIHACLYSVCCMYSLWNTLIVQSVNQELFATVCLLHVCNSVRCLCMLNRMCVLPVLKHGPRSLMYVQVRLRDRTMRNICNWLTRSQSCRRIFLNKFEC